MQIVWFKRDLRVDDNAALSEAVERGPVLPLYILEPDLWTGRDMGARHYRFLTECVDELDCSLTKLGQPLIVKIGGAVEVLNDLVLRHPIEAIWSHQETWNAWTYERDKAVRKYLIKKQIPWHEPPQNGVIRRLNRREGWSKRWLLNMRQPLFKKPLVMVKIEEKTEVLPGFEGFGLKDDHCHKRQKGGRQEGLSYLFSFLDERGQHYSRKMSSPVTAYENCSRISPYLAFGSLSVREVFKKIEERKEAIAKDNQIDAKNWARSLRAFSSRLRWHCHFIQKLEDEPQLELTNLHSHFDKLRNHQFTQKERAFFRAWKNGETGYPMIDACMRALVSTGWLNFRMRAMLMSFSSYHLWLHWREPALHLAKLFLDYEPGIHWSQCQMQSGTTGINTIRIYNPIKQGIDQDPKGEFVRSWVPELHGVSDGEIHMPWLASERFVNYPNPIVDEKLARRAAAKAVYNLKKVEGYSTIADQVVKRHASRRNISQSLKSNSKLNRAKDFQLKLPLD